MCLKAFKQAITGDHHARNWISNRMEGKPTQQLDLITDPQKIRLEAREELKKELEAEADAIIDTL